MRKVKSLGFSLILSCFGSASAALCRRSTSRRGFAVPGTAAPYPLIACTAASGFADCRSPATCLD